MNAPLRESPRAGQPAFNLPWIVVAIVGALAGLHLFREAFLSPQADVELLLALAFISARVTDIATVAAALPGGESAVIPSFVTYALVHGSWGHLVFNCLWLVAFGSAVAWRFGPGRFLLFSALGAVGGAAAHLVMFPDSLTPMVGASAAISAHMAGASRFVFSGHGPLGPLRRFGGDPAAYQFPAPPLSATLRDRRVLTFLVVWFGLNLFFGFFADGGGIASGAVAWQAHIGGFVTGLLFFSAFDPVSDRRG